MKRNILLALLLCQGHISSADKETASLLAQITPITIKHPYYSQKKEAKKLGARLTNNLTKYLQSLESVPKHIGHTDALISFIHKLTTNPHMRTYFPQLDNDESVFARLHSCFADNTMTLNVLTCPDYSGTEDAQGTWVFDFKSLGDKEGFIAQRSHNYVKEFHTIASHYIKDIKVRHYLPSFEMFPDGFSSEKQKLSYDESLGQLQKSLQSIKKMYLKSGIEAEVALTNALINDEKFYNIKDQYSQKIKTGKITHPAWQEFRTKTFIARKTLYQSFHPQEEHESATEYTARLETILDKQIAEYCADGELLTRDPHALLLVSDSHTMSEAYSLHQQPVLFGKSATSAAYKGE
jgi:hypothetical protein